MGKTPEELFSARAKRIEKASQLKIPDRVPVAPIDNGFSIKYAGLTWEEAMYDVEKLKTACKKTVIELNFDAFNALYVFSPGQVYDRLNFKELKWPGAELEANRVSNCTYQFVEPGTGYEAMPAEEYDWFLDDPTDWVIRKLWPRKAKTLEPLKDLPALWSMHCYQGMPQFSRFGLPHIASAFESLIGIGRESLKFNESVELYSQEMVKLGFPPFSLSFCWAPFDYFGDYLRGTRGIMLDMYKNPDKLKKALEKVTPWLIRKALAEAKTNSKLTKRVYMFIHKGAGGFMSNEQYKEFYWPSLREVIMGIIDGGFTPYVGTEGIYTDRLPIIKDVPRGKVIYQIESDIFKAKEILGDKACLAGGPSAAMMNLASPEEVKDYCKKLIDAVGEGGGFIMTSEVPLITAKPENVKALVEFTQEYGVYK